MCTLVGGDKGRERKEARIRRAQRDVNTGQRRDSCPSLFFFPPALLPFLVHPKKAVAVPCTLLVARPCGCCAQSVDPAEAKDGEGGVCLGSHCSQAYAPSVPSPYHAISSPSESGSRRKASIARRTGSGTPLSARREGIEPSEASSRVTSGAARRVSFFSPSSRGISSHRSGTSFVPGSASPEMGEGRIPAEGLHVAALPFSSLVSCGVVSIYAETELRFTTGAWGEKARLCDKRAKKETNERVMNAGGSLKTLRLSTRVGHPGMPHAPHTCSC